METGLSAFLLSGDPQSLSVAYQAFSQYGVRTTTCTSSSEGFELLQQRRFDLFVLDFDLAGAVSLAALSPPQFLSRASNMIALTTDYQAFQVPWRKRVRYLVQKPLTVDWMVRALRTGYRLAFTEKRRSFRCGTQIPVLAAYQDRFIVRPLNNATMLNISETGLGLETEIVVPKDVRIFVDFQLPGTEHRIHTIGKVIWSDLTGHAGIQFRFIGCEDSKKLRHWLKVRCPWNSGSPTPGSNEAMH